MPQVIAAAVAWLAPASAATALTVAGTAISYATLIGYAVTIGGSIAYGNSQNARLRNSLKNSNIDQGRNVMDRNPVAPRRLVYGEIPLAGPIMFMATSGAKNEKLHVIMAVAGHEVNALNTIYFDNFETVPLDGAGNATGKYAGYFHCEKFLGTSTQAACATLVAAVPALWTNAHRLRGVAYVYLQFTYNTDLYPNGMPTVRVLTQGKKVYDPRDGGQSSGTPSTWLYSNNSALCTADYLNDATFGKGIPWARINVAGLPAEANTCDETIVTDTGTEKRYTLNGTVTSDQSPDNVLTDMVSSMAGKVTDTGGIWTVLAGAYRTVTAPVYTDDDLIGPMTVQCRQSMRDTFSGVKGTYISPDNQWQPADFPFIKNDTYMAQDGGVRRWKDIGLPFTTSSPTAQRIAKIELERGRQQITISGLYKLKAFQIRVGDTIQITRDVLGWAAKEFEVVEWSLQQIVQGTNITLGIYITARETAAGVWNWASGEETQVDLAPNSNLPNPQTVAVPTGLTLLSDSTTCFIQDDGTFVPRLKVSWNTPNDIYIEQGGSVAIQYRKNGDPNWIFWNDAKGDALFDFIDDVKVGDNMDVQIWFRNSIGARSNVAGVFTPAQSLNYLIGGEPNPNDPTGVMTKIDGPNIDRVPVAWAFGGGKYGAAMLMWTASTSKTVAYYQIRDQNPSGSQNLRTKALETEVPVYTWQFNQPAGDLWQVRAVSRSGKVSNWVLSNGLNGGGGLEGITFNYGPGTAAEKNVAFFNQTGNNLSDVPNPGTARTNLGLGSAATASSTSFLNTSNNLSDVPAPGTARSNLGLGSAATQSTSAFLQPGNNLSDVSSAATARTNLGIRTRSIVVNLAGGSATEAITDNHAFGTVQNAVLVQCVDPAGSVEIEHDYSDAGNNANNTVFQARDPAGGIIGGGLRRFTIHYLP